MHQSSRPPHRLAPRRTRLVAFTGFAALAAALLPAVTTATAAPSPSIADDALWTALPDRAVTSGSGPLRVNPSDFTGHSLDTAELRDRLAPAPDEDARGAADNAVTVTVPAPTGELVEFAVVESSVMEPGLAAAHPEISTYAGNAVGDPTTTIRLDITPMGFHAAVRGPGGNTGAWYVDPARNGDDRVYLSYLGSDLPAPEKPLIEPEGVQDELNGLLEDEHDDHGDEHGDEHSDEGARDGSPTAGEAPGTAVTRRTYRLALVTDPSYSTYFGKQNVIAEKVTLINRVNQVYNDDLAVRLVLVDNTDELSFDTLEEATGPGPCGKDGCYTPAQINNGCTGSLLNRNRIVLGQLIGASAYDVGHIALGINGGGVAGLGVIGGGGKARGCTGLPQPEGDFMAVDYVAHEIGHQFGGPHTFNGTQVNCSGGNRSARSSVEPGSGSSVMAYAGICQQDNLQPHSDPYFSQRSITNITDTMLAVRGPINEAQGVALNGFDADGESFTLTYDGRTTAPIVRGVNYSSAGIKLALEAILPEGSTVTVAPLTSAGLVPTEPSDAGFLVTFNGGPVAATNLALLGFAVADGDVTGNVGETDKGGAQDNGGTTLENLGNRAPAVVAPEDKRIPIRTPFALTGRGADVDGNTLAYSWEQNDIGTAPIPGAPAGSPSGGTSLVSQTKTNGPLFRMFSSYADVSPAGTLQYHSPGLNKAPSTPTRVFPDMAQILANNTNAVTGTCPEPPPAPAGGGATNVPVPTIECFAEWLPTADYVGNPDAANDGVADGTGLPSLNFRLTARDLALDGGGTAYDDVKLSIDKAAGPFAVSSKNTPAAAIVGRTESVRWAVAGTNTPAFAENVRITLSTDGGRSFPHVLAATTLNDGEQVVTWPKVRTTQARIKIEAIGNYFFDVNNADFEISSSDKQAPETSFSAGPKDGAYLRNDRVRFRASSTEAGSFECRLDGDLVDCPGGVARLRDLEQRTHTFSVAAVDEAGNVDPTPVTRTFTVPLNDRELRAQREAWRFATAPNAYLRTYLATQRKGAVLRRQVQDATGLALLVGKGPGYGRVTVYLNGQELRTVSLADRKFRGRQLVRVARFSEARDGKVTIVARGGRVRIEGLGVRTNPGA